MIYGHVQSHLSPQCRVSTAARHEETWALAHKRVFLTHPGLYNASPSAGAADNFKIGTS